MNQKLLQQLAMAKEAGSNAMAKDFFAKTPGAGGTLPEDGTPGPHPQDGKPGLMGDVPTDADAANAPGQPGQEPDGDEMKPEDLEELLRLLQSQGGGQQQGQ